MSTKDQRNAVKTVREVKAVKPGEWRRVEGFSRGEGELLIRGLVGAQRFYFRYTGPDGKRVRIPLDRFDEQGRRGLSLEHAKDRARELSKRQRERDADLRTAMELEEREEARRQRASLEAERALEAKQSATVAALCTAYVEQLRATGKQSAREVESNFHRNLRAPFPDVWALAAVDLTTETAGDPIAALVEAGKLREAAKLRSYLRAAYSAAVKARTTPSAVQSLRDLRLSANPLRDVSTIDGASKSRERALSVAELRAYWRHIQSRRGASGALLRLHLLTGAQRIQQLARTTVDDIDSDAGAVRLRDGKGKRSTPRNHFVPLLPEALAAIEAMATPRSGPFLATLTGGKRPAGYDAFANAVRSVAGEMVEAGEALSPFTPGDLRRTVETRLSALGVPREVRAQLQSHGLGGVQERNYDRHDYLAEKRAALEALLRLVNAHDAEVVPIRRGVA